MRREKGTRAGAPEKAAAGGGRTLVKGVCIALAIAMDAVLALIWMEAAGRDSYSGAMVWLMEHTPYAACSAGMIALVLAALFALLGRMAPALALGNGFFLLLGAIQHVKLVLRGDPFQPSDLTMAREALGVANRLLGSGLNATAIMAVGAALLVIAVPLLFTGVRLSGKGRPVRRALCVLAACGACAGYAAFLTTLELPYIVMLTQDDYALRGFLIAFADRMPGAGGRSDVMEEPPAYSREQIEADLKPYAGAGGEPEIKPNVLFVMSESLFDVTQDLRLSEDPLACWKELQEAHWGGGYLTPVYGGGTSVSEYEVLTGYRAADTRGLAYNTSNGVIRPGMESIVSVLRSYGYFAQAIHPNGGTFYGRKSVYQMMGFDSALFIEDLDPAPRNVFPFPSDDYLFGQIIKAYEARPAGQPWFCHAITYQNHGGYGFEADWPRIRVEEELTGAQMLNARNFANMLKLSDDALRELIAYFDAQNEPVVIVVWGDHAPSVGAFGVELPPDPAQQMRYYTTPLLIYSNYGLEVSGIPRNVSSYRLGAYVLRLLGFDRDAYFNYLSSDDCENLTLFQGWVELGGEMAADEERYRRIAQTLQRLHYDRLFGEHYGRGM